MYLDDFPAQDAVDTRGGLMSDGWRRWLAKGLRAWRLSVATLLVRRLTVTGALAPTFLSSSEPLPAGAYRVTMSAKSRSGWDSGSLHLFAQFEEAPGGPTVTGPILTSSVDLATTVTVWELTEAGGRIGYGGTWTGGAATIDVLIMVEALPASNRLG